MVSASFPPPCHCEEGQRPDVAISRYHSLACLAVLNIVPGDCHVASLLAMTVEVLALLRRFEQSDKLKIEMRQALLAETGELHNALLYFGQEPKILQNHRPVLLRKPI